MKDTLSSFLSRTKEGRALTNQPFSRQTLLAKGAIFVLTSLALIGLLTFQLVYFLRANEWPVEISGGQYQLVFGLGLLSSVLLVPILAKYLVKDLLLSLGLAYFSYVWLSDLIVRSYHLNDPGFKGEPLFNQSWQTNPIVWLVLLTAGLSLIIGRFFKSRLDFIKLSPIYALSGLLALTAVTDGRFVHLLSANLRELSEQGVAWFSALLQVFLLPFLVFWLLAFAFLKALEAFKTNRSNAGLALFTSFVLAAGLNYFLQSGYKGDGAYYGFVIVPGAISFQITFFTLAFFLCYLFINRYLLTTLILVHVSVPLAIANTMKMAMRAEPLLITDFVWVKELSFLAGFIDKGTLYQVIAALILVWLAYAFGRNYFLKSPIIGNRLTRLCLVFGIFLFAHQVQIAFQKEKEFKIAEGLPVISKLNNKLDLNWLGFTMTARYKSLAFVWTKQLTKSVMDMPEGYNSQAIEQLAEKYQAIAEQVNETRDKNLTDQTLIFILSESFANPTRVPGVKLSEPVIPNILDIQEKTTSGLMTTAFYGGGTANLEFQSLTGLPFSNFSPSVSIAYTEVVPKMAYFPSISAGFAPDNRIAIHPYGAINYGRLGIYHQLGFNKFLALSGSNDEMTKPDPLGVYVSDSAVYDNILEQLDENASQFFSVITMQNHAPWSMNEPAQLVATGEGFSEQENNHLTAYSRLLTHTDEATKIFLDKLAALDKDITIVFYGDHLPGFYPASAFETKPESQYQTDYFIWSNKQPNKKLPSSTIGANDFIAQFLAHTGTKVTPYQALLTKYLEDVSSNSGELSEEALATFNDLLLLQYDVTVGKGYMKNQVDFFGGNSQ